MAKSDFDLDDQDYDVVFDDTKKNKLFHKNKIFTHKNESVKNESVADTAIIDNLNSNLVSNSSPVDLGDFAKVDSYDSNVVFEEKTDMTFLEKVKDYFSTINIRMLIVIAGIFLIVFVISFMIIINIVKSNKAYSADIIVPNVVYMGETSSIYVSSKYAGPNKPKKDINNTETLFTTNDSKVLYILNNSVKGSSVVNTIIPVQEGRATVEVSSKLDGRVIGSSKTEVVVCPAFDNSLLHVKDISITKGSTYNLEIDFGESECARNVTYSSSNEKVATVDENGYIKGIELGKSILTIRRGTKSISLTIDVTDKYVSLQSFKVIPNELQLSEGEKYRLHVDYYPANATNFDVRFYSNDETIVKVSKGGLIEAISPGSTTIKVMTMSYKFDTIINITVKDNKSGSFATNMVLDSNAIKLVEGKSKKINVILTPKNVNSSIISWQSSNDDIASVTSDGIIYAKSVGDAIITATTDNGISRKVNVTVIKMKKPIISSSDGIESDSWHVKPYVLSFSGSNNGVVYYYGNSIDQINSIADKLTISVDENKSYYVRACTRVCTETCLNKKDKSANVEKGTDGEPIKVCSSKCSDKPSVCSDPVSYISKYDRTKPIINAVAGIDSSPTKADTVQISVVDNMSLVQKWCVTTKNNYASCKWKTIQSSANPVVEYTAVNNDIYYVFAKDVAGNISNSYKFEITNIE